MSFLNPLLAGLGAAFIALPIVLHFLRRRRKPVMWGAMRFLVEAYRRKRRRMTLEQLLLLASRCLLVLFFAMAIGQPVFGGASTQSGPQELYIVLDDSIASAADDGTGTAFDRHKSEAIELLAGLAPEAGDRAGLVLMSGPARGIVTPASSDIAAVRRAIERLERTDAAADLEGAMTLLSESIRTEEPDAPAATVALVGTLRQGSVDPERPLPRLDNLGRDVRFIVSSPAQEPLTNVGITSVEPIRSVVLGEAEQEGQALVRVERSGSGLSDPQTVGITLSAGGEGNVSQAEATFEPGQTSSEVMVGFTMPPAEIAAWPTLTAEIAGDANNADNTSTTTIDRRDALRVGIVASRPLVGQVGIDRFTPADWVRLALSPGETTGELRIVDITPSLLDAPRLATLDAVVLLEPDELANESWTLLRRFVDRSGLLVVTPPADDSVQLWTDSMTESLGLDWTIAREPIEPAVGTKLDVERRNNSSMLALIAGELEQLASSVSYSKILPIETRQNDESVILALDDDSPLLVSAHPSTESGRVSTGLVVYLATSPSLTWTDLPTRPLMVPLLQEIVRQGVGLASDRAVRVAGQLEELPAQAAELLNTEGEPTQLPIRTAGRFEIQNAAGEITGVLAVRPDVSGSRIGLQTIAELGPWLASSVGGSDRLQWLGDQDEADSADSSGTLRRDSSNNLAFWLIVSALAFAVIETLLARWSARSMTLHSQPEPQS